MDAQRDSTGRTKDVGWELGVRRSVSRPLPEVWEFLLGDGLALWLGDTALVREKGAGYRTADGVVGEVRSITERAKLRLSWRPDDWPHDTLLKLTVKEAADGGTTIGIQHEQLADRDERFLMLGHWKNVVAELGRALERY